MSRCPGCGQSRKNLCGYDADVAHELIRPDSPRPDGCINEGGNVTGYTVYEQHQDGRLSKVSDVEARSADAAILQAADAAGTFVAVPERNITRRTVAVQTVTLTRLEDTLL